MKSELILTSSEVEDLAVCVDCGLQECMDCPRNKAKQKLKEAARDKGDVSNGIYKRWQKELQMQAVWQVDCGGHKTMELQATAEKEHLPSLC